MKNTTIIDETINWNKVENKMTATQAEAPYLGVIQTKGSVGFEDFVKGVKEDGCSESELEIRRVMTKHEELMKGYVAQNYKVYCPFGIAGVHITKSFPAQDAPFDPTVNEAILALQTNAETRNALAGVKLKEDKAAAAVLKGPKINSVCTDGTRFGAVVCYQPFSVAGSGLLLDPSKATDRLTLTSDKTGAVTDVTDYTCDGEGFRVDAQVNASLTPGKYTLTAYVDMGDEEHPNVLTATSKVTVEAGDPPPPPPSHFDSATSEGCREGYVMPNSKVTVTGVGLRVPTEDESFFIDMPEGKGRANFTDVSVSADGTALTGHVGDWPEGAVPGDGYVVWLDAEGATIAVCDVEVGT